MLNALIEQSTTLQFTQMKHEPEGKVAIDMRFVVEFCTKLAFEACKIVKECFKNESVKTFMKGPADPVTEADLKIQTMLIRGIRKSYPHIKIVGEEDVEYQGEISTNYETLKDIYLPEEFKLDQKYHEDDVCIWIDPIDNTKGFIDGHSEAVTVLIGISHKGKAQFGVIGTPYQLEGNEKVYKPCVRIACVSQRVAYQMYEHNRKWKQIHRPQPNGKPVVVLSPTRKNVLESVIIKQLNAQKMMAGGAGYKIVLVAVGTADLLCYCDQNTKKWDSCAGQAIIRALGGFFFDSKGLQIPYDPSAKCYRNKDGIICGFVEEYKKTAITVCHKNFEAGIKMNKNSSE